VSVLQKRRNDGATGAMIASRRGARARDWWHWPWPELPDRDHHSEPPHGNLPPMVPVDRRQNCPSNWHEVMSLGKCGGLAVASRSRGLSASGSKRGQTVISTASEPSTTRGQKKQIIEEEIGGQILALDRGQWGVGNWELGGVRATPPFDKLSTIRQAAWGLVGRKKRAR
jgi:hypothetical protein